MSIAHLPEMRIKIIPHKKQRYETCGDYVKNKNRIDFKISQTTSDYEFLVLIHEMVEWYLTQKKGIEIKQIDDFDISFTGEGEPGDDPKAPYFQEHQTATRIERALAAAMNIDWREYDKTISKL